MLILSILRWETEGQSSCGDTAARRFVCAATLLLRAMCRMYCLTVSEPMVVTIALSNSGHGGFKLNLEPAALVSDLNGEPSHWLPTSSRDIDARASDWWKQTQTGQRWVSIGAEMWRRDNEATNATR